MYVIIFRKKQLIWFRHVMRMNEESLPKINLEFLTNKEKEKRKTLKNLDRGFQEGDGKGRFRPKSVSGENPVEKGLEVGR